MGVEVNLPPMEAWYFDELGEDQRLPHQTNPPQYVSLEKLADIGVLYWKLDADNFETDPELQKIRKTRGYNYKDMLTICPEKLPNYHEKIKNFYEEHLHTDEEIRYCLEGSGYFDVRDKEDRWIRIWVKKGDMIILPGGIYHRFTLDTNNYINILRLFQGEPVWTAYNRPCEEHPARKMYVHQFTEQSC
ncbi:hypothetical protein SUGI_0820050 [Cryptomeria japonica]|uniref:acireductone dioxygenase 3 n=1 Tax=Cryptomeria japonica TaxID=3369 RepID=UPI0024146D57|nr:acireductone dioxygenase 3 [Cryptomeria japonica]GLJ40051.1 hypothetical protein SUGI_0820050 [Cryptomeria japonica]